MPTTDQLADATVGTARKFPGKVTKRRVTHHLLLTEYLLFTLIVVLRAAADYVPAKEGTAKGTAKPVNSGQSGPLPVWAAGTGVFFVLSFGAARGGGTAAVANAFGGVVILTLLLRSGPELATVAGWYEALAGGPAKANASPVRHGGSQPPGTTLE